MVGAVQEPGFAGLPAHLQLSILARLPSSEDKRALARVSRGWRELLLSADAWPHIEAHPVNLRLFPEDPENTCKMSSSQVHDYVLIIVAFLFTWPSRQYSWPLTAVHHWLAKLAPAIYFCVCYGYKGPIVVQGNPVKLYEHFIAPRSYNRCLFLKRTNRVVHNPGQRSGLLKHNTVRSVVLKPVSEPEAVLANDIYLSYASGMRAAVPGT